MTSYDGNAAPRLELFVGGTPYEVGFSYGTAVAEGIDRFLRDDLARINRLRDTPLSAAASSRLAGQYAFWIEKDLPALAEEIAGLADGAGIRYEQAVLLQIRRELIRQRTDSGDCTSIATSVDGMGRIIAQTVDLTGDLSDLSLVLHVAGSNSSRPGLCLLTFLGLCGYLGMNTNGMAIGLNMVNSTGWRPGVPVYLLIPHLLTCASIDEALDELARIRRASSRYLILSDSNATVGVEMTVDDFRVLQKPVLLHSNHFLHSELRDADTQTGDLLAGSQFRFQRMAALVDRGVDTHEILKDHDGFPNSICAHNLGNHRLAETVAAVVMAPAKRELQIAFGHPCKAAFHTYRV